MKFAHFSHVWGKPGMTAHQRYEELWRELQLCDELGFDYSFCVEHHFRPDESWVSSPSLYVVGAAARTRRMRIGPMGYVVPLYHPLRLAEEIALVDQIVGGRMELGLVPGINPDYFKPFGQLAVQPLQKPHPPLWMMSRDPQTLEFCARNAINPGYFLVYPRADAAPRYRKFLADWGATGRPQAPKIAYCTIVYVDETDEKALDETFEERVREHAKKYIGRGEPGASEIMANLFDADYLMKNELVFIGSAKTVAEKIHAAAKAGLFNVFMGEFNFSDLREADLLRSIQLFGEQVIPALRSYEPF